MYYTRHLAGPITSDVQHCARCGRLLLTADVVLIVSRPWFTPGVLVYENSRGRMFLRPALNVTINECRKSLPVPSATLQIPCSMSTISETVKASTLATIDALVDACDTEARRLKSSEHKQVQRAGFDIDEASNRLLRAAKAFRERSIEQADPV